MLEFEDRALQNAAAFRAAPIKAVQMVKAELVDGIDANHVTKRAGM